MCCPKKKILNETKKRNPSPSPCKLNGRSLNIFFHYCIVYLRSLLTSWQHFGPIDWSDDQVDTQCDDYSYHQHQTTKPGDILRAFKESQVSVGSCRRRGSSILGDDNGNDGCVRQAPNICCYSCECQQSTSIKIV